MPAETSYESYLEAAKKVLQELNASDLPLTKATELYKEGARLLEAAAKLIESAKIEFEELQNAKDSTVSNGADSRGLLQA